MLVLVPNPDACGGSELHSYRLKVHTLRWGAQTLGIQTVGEGNQGVEALFEGG